MNKLLLFFIINILLIYSVSSYNYYMDFDADSIGNWTGPGSFLSDIPLNSTYAFKIADNTDDDYNGPTFHNEIVINSTYYNINNISDYLRGTVFLREGDVGRVQFNLLIKNTSDDTVGCVSIGRGGSTSFRLTEYSNFNCTSRDYYNDETKVFSTNTYYRYDFVIYNNSGNMSINGNISDTDGGNVITNSLGLTQNLFKDFKEFKIGVRDACMSGCDGQYLDELSLYTSLNGETPIINYKPNPPIFVLPTPINNSNVSLNQIINMSNNYSDLYYYLWFGNSSNNLSLVLNNNSKSNYTTDINLTLNNTYYFKGALNNITSGLLSNNTSLYNFNLVYNVPLIVDENGFFNSIELNTTNVLLFLGVITLLIILSIVFFILGETILFNFTGFLLILISLALFFADWGYVIPLTVSCFGLIFMFFDRK